MRSCTRRLLSISSLALMVLMLFACGKAPPPSTVPPSHPVPPSATPEKIPTATATAGPENVYAYHFGLMDLGSEESARDAMELGVQWGRDTAWPFSWGLVEKEKGAFDFSEPDRFVQMFQAYGIRMTPVISPYADWDQSTCHEKGDEAIFEKAEMQLGLYRQKPCDMDGYAAFVRRLVERYDGDGVEDMPGLEMPVKAWEVLNEPFAGDVGFASRDKVNDYFDILRVSYVAIKEADPEAIVLLASTPNLRMDREYYAGILQLGAADYFDVFNYHADNKYPDLDLPFVLSFMQDYGIDKPLWVTEFEMSEISAGTDAPLTDEEWAWAMAKEHIYAFAGGAEKIFYIGLYPAKSPEGTWLIYQEIEKSEEGGEKRVIIKNRQEKPAYYAYRTMVTVLEGFREAENLDPEAYLFRGEGIGEEDVRAMFDLTRHVLERGRYRFLLADGREIYVLWGEGDLPPELQGEVRVTDWRGETSTILAEDLRPDDAPLYVETLP